MSKAHRHTRLLLSVLLVVAVSPSAFADRWYESYENGEQALREQDWQAAVQHLQAALAQKGDSGAKVRTYGMHFVDYFPYLKLGIAHFELGNYDAALQSFEAEERLVAVAEVSAAYSQLQQYRELAREAKAQLDAQSSLRIVTDSLAQARRLEQAGDLNGARAELEKARAVAGEDDRVVAALAQLQGKITARELELLTDKQVSELIAEGRRLLDGGQFKESASTFIRAIQLDPGATEAIALVAEAQDKLAARLESERDAQQRQKFITDSLRRAGDLEQSGDFIRAMDELQSVLALDRENASARSMQRRLQQKQAVADQDTARTGKVAQLVADAQRALDDGDFAQAISSANLALALDLENVDALRLFTGALSERRRQLLGSDRQGSVPPAITFTNQRLFHYLSKSNELITEAEIEHRSDITENIQQAELTRARNFVLTGTVSDTSPIDVVFYESRAGDDPAIGADELDDTVLDAFQTLDGVIVRQRFGGWHTSTFRVESTLRPGASQFLIMATGEGNVPSASTFLVYYQPPFWRSRWFYYAVVAIVAALALVPVVLRVRRRNELLKRKVNPYIAGAPIMTKELFFGRQHMLNRIIQTVHNNSMLLYGERRIGKTSLQHHIKRRLKEIKDSQFVFYPVYIDLQGTPQEEFFSTMAHDIFEELGPIIEEVLANSALKDDSVTYGYREFARDLRAVIKILKKHAEPRQPKLTLLIDEVDELNNYDPRINQKLRSLFMKSFAENLVSVVSGVSIKKHWESEGSPWYNFFEEMQVKPFHREDAEKLIKRPIQDIFKLNPGVVDRIISLTDCKPYLIQKLCISLVNRIYEQERRTIHVSDVEAIGRPEET